MTRALATLVHPVTRIVLILWVIGAFKFGYLVMLLFARLPEASS